MNARPPGGAEGIEEALEEAEFFTLRGLIDDAKAILVDALARAPNHPLLVERLRELDGNRRARAAPTSAPAPEEIPADDRVFDIAASLDALDVLEQATRSSRPPTSLRPVDEIDVDQVFAKFKEGVRAQISDSDSSTHYDLGVAYKEMGLLPDAITEFAMAARDPKLECTCFSMIGMIQLEQGAVRSGRRVVYRRARSVAEDDRSGDEPLLRPRQRLRAQRQRRRRRFTTSRRSRAVIPDTATCAIASTRSSRGERSRSKAWPACARSRATTSSKPRSTICSRVSEVTSTASFLAGSPSTIFTGCPAFVRPMPDGRSLPAILSGKRPGFEVQVLVELGILDGELHHRLECPSMRGPCAGLASSLFASLLPAESPLLFEVTPSRTVARRGSRRVAAAPVVALRRFLGVAAPPHAIKSNWSLETDSGSGQTRRRCRDRSAAKRREAWASTPESSRPVVFTTCVAALAAMKSSSAFDVRVELRVLRGRLSGGDG